MPTLRTSAFPSAAAVVLGAGLAASSPGLTILRSFNATNSYIDPFGVNRTSELTGVFNAAADMWESVIQTPHTLALTYQWGSFFGSGTISEHTLSSQSGGRETAGTIVFNGYQSIGVARYWYLDSTPFSDSEFNVQQTSWRDLTAGQKSDQFSGTIQNTFEVGSGGAAFANAPDAARFGYDMLTYALHEIGHALGMDNALNGSINQAFADGDYDLSSQFTGGVAGFAARVPGAFPVFDIEHLRGEYSLMDATIGTGQRRGISALDALAAASGSGWTSLDLARKEFVGASNAAWTSGSSWIGGATPDSGDLVFVRDQRTASINAPGNAGDLVVTEGAVLNINSGAFLTVSDVASLSGGATVRVAGTGTFFVQSGGTLSMIGGSWIDMAGGQARMAGGGTIGAGTRIEGFGSVITDGLLVNNGTIRATEGNLLVSALGAGSIDLDGASNNAVVQANTGDLTINAPLVDHFNGDMIVAAGRTLTMTQSWIQGMAETPPFQMDAGLLDLNGGISSSPATLAGGAATLRGDVEASGVAHINAPVIFGTTVQVSVANGGRLEMNNATTMLGGSYTGTGELQMDGALTVNGSTTIGVTTFDWDGENNNTTTTVNNGATLTLNSTYLDLTGATFERTFRGSLLLNGGADLVVNGPFGWDMSGSIQLNGGSIVGGQPVTIRGSVDSNGSNSIDTTVTFDTSASVSLAAAGDSLALNGATTYAGGAFAGAGRLSQNGDASVIFNATTIGVGVYDWDGADGSSQTSIGTNASLVLNVGMIDAGDNVFDGIVNIGSGGSLTVNTAANSWTNSGTVNLQGGSLLGETVINTDTITGFGTIGSSLINNGTIAASGGTLLINTATFPDIDGNGAPEVGVLSALAGNLRVVNTLGGYGFDGTMNVGAGRTMSFDSADIFNGGVINMITGGALVLDSLNQNAEMNISGGTATIQADSMNFNGTSDTTIGSTLVVAGATTISPTASMIGGGTLRIDGSLAGNFDIAVNLENRGVFNPGTSTGAAGVDGDFTQTASGRLNVEIDGLAPNQHDRLFITGHASLAGELDIALGGGFTPDWGDRWSILTYDSVSGDFDAIAFTPLADPLLFWWAEATADSYDIGVRFVADINHDDAVDFQDLNLVVSSFNTFGAGLIGDADEDGDVDFTDLNYVVSYFNTFAPVNVPAPGSAALMALSLLTGLRRGRD